MKIEFEEDRSNGYLMYFAISKMEIWKGKVHDELMWAELTPGMSTILTSIPPIKSFLHMDRGEEIQIKWEDDYYNPVTVSSLKEAKDYINNNFSKHTPHINGGSYNIPR